jgi:hypothetical protein
MIRIIDESRKHKHHTAILFVEVLTAFGNTSIDKDKELMKYIDVVVVQ